MYVPESKIIQLFLKSMCPAQKRCHPSQSSATCNLFCLRVSGYVSGALIASWALPRPCRLFLGSHLCEGLLPEAACLQRNRALGWLDFIFRAFPFIFPGGVPLGAAPRPLRAVRLAVAPPLPGSPLLLTSARAGHWHGTAQGRLAAGGTAAPCPLGHLSRPGSSRVLSRDALAAWWVRALGSTRPSLLFRQLPLPSVLQRNLVTVCLNQLKCNWE